MKKNRLIEDTSRRFKGEFFTPTEWVNEAHKMISESFGEDWKEKYVVWDNSWGTGNLTRDYQFKELYCSTINQSDIDLAEQNGYNRGSVKFQYDFLNDGVENGEIVLDEKMPVGLRDAIAGGKDIIIFMNPPYGSVQSFDNIKLDGGQSRNSIEQTNMKSLMNKDKIGLAVKNLYSQFLYKLYKIKDKYNSNINICVYSPPLFLTGSDFRPFREKFLEKFSYFGGMLFNAANFANVSNWGLSFTMFKNDGNGLKNNFTLKVKDFLDFEISEIDSKVLYNIDDPKNGCNNWIRNEIKGIKATLDYPKMSSALEVKQKGYSNLTPKSFGYYYTNGNNVYYNNTNVSIFSSCFSGKSGLSIIKENIKKCAASFTSRKSIQSNWINQKDEYMAPNTEHPDYEQWNNDAIVYSLFNTSSNQSSMRQVEYKGKLWDIKNEFFWLSRDLMLRLADKHKNDLVYQDVKNTEQERYVHELLKNVKLSPDALELLDLSVQLIEKTFPYRSLMDEKYHLNTWDAGWYQIKCIMKEYKDVFKNDMNHFNTRYKAFEDRMREGVYKFGFLK